MIKALSQKQIGFQLEFVKECKGYLSLANLETETIKVHNTRKDDHGCSKRFLEVIRASKDLVVADVSPFQVGFFEDILRMSESKAFVIRTQIFPTSSTPDKETINDDHSTVIVNIEDNDYCFHIDS